MKMVAIRMDDNTLNALDLVIAHESEKRLHKATISECVRYLIMKEALSLKKNNKKTDKQFR